MASTPVKSDREFAIEIARREPQAVSTFRSQHNDRLDDGYAGMVQNLQETRPPGCDKSEDDLCPHVVGAVGEGFLTQCEKLESHSTGDASSSARPNPAPPPTIHRHFAGLVLDDLFHASACLKHDQSACLRLVDLVDNEIGPSIVRRYRNRLSAGRAQEIVDDVLSQTWSVTNSTTGQPAALDSTPGHPAPRLRLEKYYGLSRLKTWLYTMASRLCLDEIRRPNSDNVSMNTDRGPDPTRATDQPPDEQAADRELVERFKPTLQTELNKALDALKERKNPRLAHVAYLWLPYRTQQVFISELFGVTKARVSQQAKEITEHLISATEPVCRRLAAESGISFEQIQAALKSNLPGFFVPVISERLLDHFRQLRDTNPRLLHVAFLLWRQGHPPAEIAEQLGESGSRIATLIEQLDAWRRDVQHRLAHQLGEESTVPTELLARRIDLAVDESFSGREPPASLEIQQDDPP